VSKISRDGPRAPEWEPDTFGWSRRRVGDADVISLAGELDMAVADELHLLLMTAAASGTAATIVLDLSDLSFIDARCTSVIAAAWATARRHGVRLEVVGLHGTPELVFDVLGLTPILARRREPSDGGRGSGGRDGWAGRIARRRSAGGTRAAG